MFLNKIDLLYCLVVFFVVCPPLRPFWSVFGELALFWCSSLFLDQSNARTAEKKIFWDQPPLPLSQGLDDSHPTQATERLDVVLASDFASRIANSGSRDSSFVKWKETFRSYLPKWPYRSKRTTFKAGPEHSGRTKPKWLVPFDVPAEISLAQALPRSFSRWASLACRLFFLFLCLSLWTLTRIQKQFPLFVCLFWLFSCHCFTTRGWPWVAIRFPAKVTSSCIWVAIPVELVCLWCVRTCGGSDGRTVTWLPKWLPR